MGFFIVGHYIKEEQILPYKNLKQLTNLWSGTDRTTEIRFLRACIFYVATYGCETWTLNKTAEKFITAFELKCYRRVLRIYWTERRTNQSILQELRIENNWLLNQIITRKIKYFGHVKRHQGLEKTIMEGMMLQKRRREDQGEDKCKRCDRSSRSDCCRGRSPGAG